MSVLLQISDTHFGTEQAPVVAALEALVRDTQPALVVLSGDITQRATRAQFGAARAFMDRLPVPWVAIPGNHDIPLFQLGARLLTPYGRYVEAFGAELEPEFVSPDWLVVTVNTTRWYRHTDGEVSEAQIERVARRLERATPAQVRIVVTHQPVLVTRPEDRGNRLHGADAALRRWAAAGADVVMGGHIHLPFVRPAQDADASLSRALWTVQAGTAVSSRVRGGQPNSVNLLRPGGMSGPRSCTVERWDHAAAEGRFVPGQVHTLALADV
ncbi:metallophosphoesterase family protein [Variovorax sp. N23]|uniref:metallophosphoesterase family protein n=1 Tax=Variovorax sp. N23 TaxID=2980555 RepID=UPI0021C61C9D|nr:metallophosphoesterase [Variovorax sp. N23]MCU4118281.1 metallophosphoesterase [Variovorax sp. N23]